MFVGWWYVTLRVNGRRKQIKLAEGKENRAAAFDEYFRLIDSKAALAGHAAPVSSISVLAVLDKFLDYCIHECSAETTRIYRHFLESFARSIRRDLCVHELKPKHVTDWLLGKKWSKSTKNGAVGAVRRAFHWLRDEGHIPEYPLHGLKAPRKNRREVIVSAEDFKVVLEKSDRHFQDLLRFLWLTGARPQEARAVEARHVDLKLRRIVFPPSEAKGQEHPRVIYLSDEAALLVERLAAKFPDGPIFRNRLRRPWSKDSIRCRFRRLREKTGQRFCAYHFRHTFATNALQRLDPITVSVLMGHSDASMLARTYQHLAKNPVAMLEAAKRAATPEGA
jgi:integrase